MGIISSIAAGILMSLQGVFNTRLTEKVGNAEANLVVQGTGLVLSLLVFLFFNSGNLKRIHEVNKLYLAGGFIGVLIIYTVVQGIQSLGTTCAVGVILVSQLIAAAVIDTFGLFGAKQACFHISKLAGVALMIGGIVVFKLKG